MTTQVERRTRLFNVAELHAMDNAGILSETDYHELIGGRIYVRDAGGPRLFNVDEYYAMADMGILRPDERVELINGEIVEKLVTGPVHARTVDKLLRLLFALLGDQAWITSQNPLHLDIGSEPEPDVMILNWGDEEHLDHPGPDDTLLLIEVSDSTLYSDRNAKLFLYAQNDVPETWIVNIPDRVIEVHTNPVGGVYQNRQVFGPDESVSPSAFPDVSLPVSRIVPA